MSELKNNAPCDPDEDGENTPNDSCEEELEEGFEYCPLCNRLNQPGAMDHCDHYVGSYWDGEIIWSNHYDQYATEWGVLSSLIEDIQARDEGVEFEQLLLNFSDTTKEMIRLADSQWSSSAGAISELENFSEGPFVETSGMCSGSGWSLYHSNKDIFIS